MSRIPRSEKWEVSVLARRDFRAARERAERCVWVKVWIVSCETGTLS